MKFIIANWKENPDTLDKAFKLIEVTNNFNHKNKHREDKIEIAHAVPSIYAGALAGKAEIFLQDIFQKEEGAYTGKFGAKMAQSVGINFSLVGHSETRESKQNKKGYTDLEIAEKVQNLLKNKMWVGLCVGEDVRDKKYFEKIKKQLDTNLYFVKPKEIQTVCIAYEPVWAIGKDAVRSATEAEIKETIFKIRKYLGEKFGEKNTKDLIVLYGGSVDEKNAKSILNIEGVTGLLIGRASADKKKWESLLKSL